MGMSESRWSSVLEWAVLGNSEKVAGISDSVSKSRKQEWSNRRILCPSLVPSPLLFPTLTLSGGGFGQVAACWASLTWQLSLAFSEPGRPATSGREEAGMGSALHYKWLSRYVP